MKKKIPFIHCIFVSVFPFLMYQTGWAQIPNPSEWNLFVQSSNNRQICDTFRMQTFEDPLRDNWNYHYDNPLTLIDANDAGIAGQGGRVCLKFPLNSNLCFDHYSVSKYTDVKIRLRFGATQVILNEDLKVRTYRSNETDLPAILSPKDNIGVLCPFKNTTINNNPPGFDLVSSPPASETLKGYYCLDSAYAYGIIPEYSLFTGSGYWNDTLRWSHLPAARYRNALIQGQATADSDIQCNEVFLSGGMLHIATGCKLIVNYLTLFNTELLLNKDVNKTDIDVQSYFSNGSGLLTSSGNIHVNKRVTISRTFSEKGKWYFISFPFDVYPDGIDSAFELHDNTSDSNGNYFYVQTYDGESRSQSNKAEGNWKVLPASAASSSLPVFKKNKGYLIALDDKATQHCISFSSAIGDIPDDFGKNGCIPVWVSPSISGSKDENQGWYLCGNPFPYPLLLSDITTNESLDGNIYLFNGSEYTAYPLNGDFALPPFAAFFVKATGNTEIRITSTSMNKNARIIASSPLSATGSEPVSRLHPTSLTDITSYQSYIKEGKLYLDNLFSGGLLEIIDFSGHICKRQVLPVGASTVDLPRQKGIYILNIKSKTYHRRHKFVCL